MRIGLMGGTFDPIHVGHLFIAEEARVRCGLEKVVFIPNNQPAQREGKAANAATEVRFELTALGIADNPNFEISRIEVDRPGPSYLFDTLQHFRTRNAEDDLYFIMGVDSLRDMRTWYRSQELFPLCHFIVASRPGTDIEALTAQFADVQWERIQLMNTPELHISSTDLRERVRNGWPIRYLVPDTVERDIRKRGLYRSHK